jgi:glycerol-3-phosphate dehydrogenase
VWQDAFMPRSERVVIECLRWAEALGAELSNYTAFVAGRPIATGPGWRLELLDRHSGTEYTVTAGRVINAAGPAVDEIAAALTIGRADPLLIPTQAWNLLLRREPVSRYSIAAKPPGAGRRTYFVHPFHGQMLAGTGHIGVVGSASELQGVNEHCIEAMLQDLNDALPGIALRRADVAHVLWGVLPGVRHGSEQLLMRPRMVDHGRRHGVPGVWSVLGVKFTEAPFVAEQVWTSILGARGGPLPARPQSVPVAGDRLAELDDSALGQLVQEVFEREWCTSDEDLLRRRTDAWMDDELSLRIARFLPNTRRAGGEPGAQSGKLSHKEES